ncbi:PH domain-containing protein [Microbacterium sp. ARD31]|uniref:PH domain-containing protein n=1 Tax=Microbacterium sp. ARD31 TaxID=2962576 RepID=UPI0028829C72|nr:PH domain-containing protein [Microbacterium sp. ARD31]MDT0186454.1 PH domain-containing protein [Microbacterium sp. ARD31]
MTDVAPPPPESAPAPAPAPPPALVRSPLSDGEWHRLHPLTPLLRGGLTLLVVAGVIVANLRDRLTAVFLPWLIPESGDEFTDFNGDDPIDFVIENDLYIVAFVAVLVVLAVLVGLFYLSWRFHSFRITGDDVEVRSGVLFRTQRRAPLDRVQGVNLTRPMIARLVGLAKLEVVGAGADANVKLEYLSTANAETIRADILRLASGRRLGAAGVDAATAKSRGVAALGHTVSRGITGLIEGEEAPVAEPASVVRIPVGRLIASHVLSPTTLWLLAGLVAVVIGVANSTPWLLFGFIPAIIGVGAYWVRSITRSLRYSIAPTEDGVRITFGLLTTVTEIVPPGRIHAIEVSQSILWRPAGWWSVRINRLSGRSASDGSTDQFTTVLPVGTTADVEAVLRLVLPHVPETEWPLIVHEGVRGTGAADSFTTSPRRAWPIRPLSWRRNGFLLTADALLLRRGAIWRTLTILPLARLQSLAIHQGPVDRMLRVASLRGNVVAGPVTTDLAAVDRDVALAAFGAAADGAVRAAGTDRTHRWWATEESAT